MNTRRKFLQQTALLATGGLLLQKTVLQIVYFQRLPYLRQGYNYLHFLMKWI